VSVLAKRLVDDPGPLGLIPPPVNDADGEQLAAVIEAYGQLNEEDRLRLSLAVGILQHPTKVADLHHTVADRSISRSGLAWCSNAEGLIVALSCSGALRRINLWTRESLAASIRSILAASDQLRDDSIGVHVSTNAAIVFLASVDQIKANHLASMLSHTEPLQHFSVEELGDRLKDAASQDFRWPLLFVEKLIPANRVCGLSNQDVHGALQELLAAGLIETAAVDRFEHTDAGSLMADGIQLDICKVALGLTQTNDRGELGRDGLFLFRGAFHLFMVGFSGDRAVVAAVSSDELDELLAAALQFPAPESPVRPHAAPAEAGQSSATPPPLASAATTSAPAWYYVENGATKGPIEEVALRALLSQAELPPSTNVWKEGMEAWSDATSAGLVTRQPEPASGTSRQFCPSCGQAVIADAHFCGSCGARLVG
jgi:hypothetical protein